MDAAEKRYLELLSRSFPTVAKASAEVINLSAILNLPKGTEFFASDIHGEYEAFSHILRNGSGSIRLKIMMCLATNSRRKKSARSQR